MTSVAKEFTNTSTSCRWTDKELDGPMNGQNSRMEGLTDTGHGGDLRTVRN